jgi:hypothetical protein
MAWVEQSGKPRLLVPSCYLSHTEQVAQLVVRLWVRDRVACSMFSVVDRLPSMPSARACSPLFRHFASTKRSPESSCWTSGSPSRAGPPHLPRRASMGSPGSRSFRACLGCLTAQSPADAREGASAGIAFRHIERRRHSGRDYMVAQCPACWCPRQRFDGNVVARHMTVGVVRYPFLV